MRDAIKEKVRPQNILRGVTIIILTMFMISVQDVIFKLFSNTLTLWQIFTLRALLTLPLFLVLARAQGIPLSGLLVAFHKWPLLRAVCFTLTFMAFYAAIPFLSLSTVGAAVYLSPIFVTLLAAFALHESVGVLGWVAVIMGFVGVVVLLQPGTDAFSLWSVLPVGGAFFYAIAHTITRSKCQEVSLTALALSTNLMMLAAGVIMSVLFLLWQPEGNLANEYPYLFGTWSAVGVTEWFVLALLAILIIVNSLGLAGAYQAAPPSIIATFEYSYLVFVACWDLLFFDTSPTTMSLLGMLMIIAAGLLSLHRSSS